MAVTASQLIVKVSAEGVQETKDSLRGVSDESDHAGGGISGLLSTMGGFIGGAAIVNLAGSAFGFLKDQLVDSVKDGLNANNVLAQITAGLKSTHDASGETADSLDKMAERMSNSTGITKSAVEASQSMLLTFTNIGKDVFPQATQAVGDLATKMANGAVPSAQQMEQASIQLGKALGDPTKGYTALQRVGVTFTAQQVEQIKQMQAAGNVAGAQKVILGELNKEFGGSAEAAGKANGGLAILSAQAENTKEKIGQALIPILTQLLGIVTPIAEALLSTLTPAITGLAQQMQGSVGPAIKTVTTYLAPLAALVERVGAQVKAAALPALAQFAQFAQSQLLPMLLQVGQFLATTLIPVLGQLAIFFLQNVLPAVEQLIGFFKASVLPVLEAMVSVIATDVLPVLEQLEATILQKVLPPIERIVGYILPVLIPAFQAIGWVISNVVGPVLGLLLNILGFLLDKLADLVGVIATHVGPAFSAIGTWVHNVLTLFSNLSQAFNQAGHDLIQGLVDGIKNMLGAAVKAATDVGQGILSSVKGLFGIHSPSSVFAEIGLNLSQGLVNGVQSLDVAGAVNAHLANVTAGVNASLGLNVAGGAAGGLSGGMAPSAAAGLVAPSSVSAQVTQAVVSALGGANAGNRPLQLILDGRVVARGLLPHMAQEIRIATGIRTF